MTAAAPSEAAAGSSAAAQPTERVATYVLDPRGADGAVLRLAAADVWGGGAARSDGSSDDIVQSASGGRGASGSADSVVAVLAAAGVTATDVALAGVAAAHGNDGGVALRELAAQVGCATVALGHHGCEPCTWNSAVCRALPAAPPLWAWALSQAVQRRRVDVEFCTGGKGLIKAGDPVGRGSADRDGRDADSCATGQSDDCGAGTVTDAHAASADAAAAAAGAAVFVTAPHTLEVVRPGHRWHLREDYTGTIARAVARRLGGGWATWREDERARVKAVVAARGGRKGDGPDASNVDPNYSDASRGAGATRELAPWFSVLAEGRGGVGDPGGTALHVDVHGMAEGDDGASCILGLGAMRAARPKAAERLCRELQAALSVLPMFGGAGDGLVVGKGRLQGRWRDGVRRKTLTQLSTSADLWDGDSLPPFSHAVQAELTLGFRKRLVQRPRELDAFADALCAAFVASIEGEVAVASAGGGPA